MSPTKSTTTTKSDETPPAPQETPAEPAPGEPGREPRELSRKPAQAGGFLLYRGAYGPIFALVTTGGEGEAEVLLLRDGEIPRGRTVAVYDTAEDAERGAQEGREHVAWHPA